MDGNCAIRPDTELIGTTGNRASQLSTLGRGAELSKISSRMWRNTQIRGGALIASAERTADGFSCRNEVLYTAFRDDDSHRLLSIGSSIGIPEFALSTKCSENAWTLRLKAKRNATKPVQARVRISNSPPTSLTSCVLSPAKVEPDTDITETNFD